MIDAGLEELEVIEPEGTDILAELRIIDGMKEELNVTLALRNFLAGDSGLSPTSVGSLANTAELINRLF